MALPLAAFHRRTGGQPRSECIVCWRGEEARRHQIRKDRPEDKARRARASLAWRLRNPGWYRDRNKAHYWANRDAILAEHKEHRSVYTDRQSKRRAQQRAQFVEVVSRLAVLEIADGVCGICGTDVDPGRFHVDHIVPLSRGGEHSYVNTQPAHPSCNLRKWASA